MPPANSSSSLRDWRRLASEMVDKEIVAAGVKNERVIRAMRDTPRHEFVPPGERDHAYLDMALPIGNGQTISPPFVVASMTEAIDPQPDRPRARNRHRQRLPGGHSQPARARCLHDRNRRSAQQLAPHELSSGLVTRMSTLAPAMATRLDRGRAVRQNHRHLLAGRGPQAARGSTERRRPDGRSCRRAISANALPHAQE